MPRKKRGGLFSCLGSASDDQPVSRHEPDKSGPGLNLQRSAACNEGDAPMPDISELDAKFAELVDDLDLPAVHRKRMFDLPPEKKWQIYCSKKKGQNESSSAHPEYCIQRLQALNTLYYQKTEEEIEERTKFLEELKTALRTQTMSFVLSFINSDGLQCLIDVLANMDWETCESAIHTACIGCFKALMNNSNGRAEVLAHPTCINIISQSLITENVKTKIAVLEILGACCLVPGGHKKVLDAMCHFQQYAEERTRFQTIINDLDKSTGVHHDEFGLKIAIMSFINAALRYGAGADHLEFRIHLRFEFLMLGIQSIMDKLRRLDNLTLDRHLDFFDMIRNEDEQELAKRFGVPSIDCKSASSMLDVLKQRVGHTTCYVHLLNIFQHLLLLPIDQKKGALEYWRVVDRIIQEIAIQQEDGSDPDMTPVDIHVKHIIEKMTTDDFKDDTVSKLAKRESEAAEMRSTIDKMATKLDKESKGHEEAKAKVEELHQKVMRLEQQLNAEMLARGRLEETIKAIGSSVPDVAASAALQSLGALQPAVAAPVSDYASPPAPPGFSTPLPPPPPMLGGSAPPAPPPASGFLRNAMARKSSKLPKPSQPLKSFNWAKLPDVKLHGTIWSELDESEVVPYLDFKEIDETFSAYQKKETAGADDVLREDDEDGISKPKELSFLDNRRAQNCQILLKKIGLTNEEIAEAVMTMDQGDRLPRDVLDQMLKFMPTQDETNILSSHAKEVDQFAAGDRFIFEMSKIPRYEQRLKALAYKKAFGERMADIKPRIECVVRACKQTSRSKRLRTLLEVVLCLGNYMNKGARANAAGFKLSSLNKIVDTKSSADRKITLLHYLLDILEKKFPPVFNIEEELADIKNACKVNTSELLQEIAVLKAGLTELEKELEYHSGLKKNEKLPNDRFVDVISSFVKVSNFSVHEVEEMSADMKERLEKTITLFGDDPKALTSDEFFGTFNAFLTTCAEVKLENIAIKKKKEEEARKAKDVMEQRERDKQRLANKSDINVYLVRDEYRQSVSERNRGEFDDLISALRTGDVFGDDLSKFKGRKRTGRQRVANGTGASMVPKPSMIARDRQVHQEAVKEIM